MAEALIGGLLQTGLFKKEKILATDVQPQRLELMRHKFGINVSASNLEAVQKGNILLIAVKPQNLKDLLGEVGRAVDLKKLVISIAAGVRMGKIEQLAGRELRLIRVMPNMPALVRSGISVFVRGKNASAEDAQTAKQILEAVGEVLETEQEEILDAVTALSGSGPAYFFYFIEALTQAGVKLGLSSQMAARLAQATGAGALKLLQETKESPADLRRKVTSPGGTTEAALKVMEAKGLNDLIQQALQAATERSRQLSQA